MKKDIFKEVADAIETVQEAIEKEKPKDGEHGVSVVGGKVVDGELILTLSTGSELNVGIVKGKDGENGEDGKDAVIDKESIVKDILNKIPKPEKINEAVLIEKILSKIPKSKVPTVNEIIDKIKTGRQLSYLDLKNLPDIVELIKKYTAHLEGGRTIVGSGASAISRMLDVDLAGLEVGQVLSWNGRAWVPATPSGGSVADDFEEVAKNLASYPYEIAYAGENIDTITYDTGSGFIVKTFNYTGDNLTSIVITGAGLVNDTKTLIYSGDNLIEVTYS